MKSRKGLWLSLTVIVLAGVLALVAFNSNFSSTKPASVPQQVTLSLEFDTTCLDCHAPGLPDATWYCHSVLPTENYGTRMYLGDHLEWLTPHLMIPKNLYVPLASTVPQNEVQVHLFDRTLVQSFTSINVGTKVTWTNLDIRDHTLLSKNIPGQWPFEAVVLKPGESVSYTFQTAGVFSYTYEYVEFRPSEAPLYHTIDGKITVVVPK
jgi:plastocyanin